MNAIEVNNLSVDYNGVVALDDVSFSIQEKNVLGILGPNGGGKSTLLKAILNLVEPSKGDIKIARDKSLSYVPQFATFERNFPIKVIEVILTASLPSRITPFHHHTKDEKNRALEIMKELDIYELRNRQISHLSGGQLQKVLIARALMTGADIILLDEPTANLDNKVKQDICQMLNNLKRDKTVLIVTHDLDHLDKCLDSVLYLNKRVLFNGKLSGLGEFYTGISKGGE